MPTPLRDVATVFLRLGILGFGGPAAHIAMMKQEVVDRRQWLSERDFVDLVGATNLIPGPNSTEMAMHVGLHQAGVRGLIVAGLCFIVPAVLITGVIAWMYEQWGTLPEVMPFVYGIRPALLGVIISVMSSFGKTTIKSIPLAIIAVGQFTPGPVFSSATFLGWQLAGIEGAIAATIGIFLPSFIKHMAGFLDAVNVASDVLILYVCYLIGVDAVVDWRTTIIAGYLLY